MTNPNEDELEKIEHWGSLIGGRSNDSTVIRACAQGVRVAYRVHYRVETVMM
jgi:hypothetical protein